MTELVTCYTYNTGIAAKQDKLKTCAGADLPGGTKMPSCDEVDAKIAAATPVFASGTNTTKSGTGTSADPIKFNVAAASSTVVGVTRYATNEETRLGATDANKATTAVTPDDLSYTLQTGKEYKIHTEFANPIANVGAANIYSNVSAAVSSGVNAIRGQMGITSSSSDQCAIRGDVAGTINTTAFSIAGVYGTNTASGTGWKVGVSGNVTATSGTHIGVYGQAAGGTTNWAGYFDGNVAAGPITTLSDATLKENVIPIDPAKALQFRNGLRWVTYEMFTEQQEQITETVTDAEGNETQVPTGRYEVKRQSLGQKYGLIAQEIQALTEKVGAFGDVVSVVGEYFTLDKDGYPVKDAQGNNIVNKRLGLDYDAISMIVMSSEQAIKTDPASGFLKLETA